MTLAIAPLSYIMHILVVPVMPLLLELTVSCWCGCQVYMWDLSTQNLVSYINTPVYLRKNQSLFTVNTLLHTQTMLYHGCANGYFTCTSKCPPVSYSHPMYTRTRSTFHCMTWKTDQWWSICACCTNIHFHCSFDYTGRQERLTPMHALTTTEAKPFSCS